MNFILDTDGVLNDGKFYYSEKGKILKKFGAHDNDGLKILKNFLDIKFISADKKGFLISKKRVADMGLKLIYCSEKNRYNYCKKIGFNKIIYMGDGIYDYKILRDCKFGISPKNAIKIAKKYSDYVTKREGGDGAIFEACEIIIKKILKKNIYKLI